jgi:argininosuccinate synthase
MKMDRKKIILAYSGGLDTSVILKWLVDRGFEVVAYVADVGQDDDFQAATEKALATGASKVRVEDLKEEFVKDYIFRALKANAIYEGRYLLGTSLARPLIAKKQIEIARDEGTNRVAHGATGKGNDQVRFELSYYALMPEVRIYSPWKDPDFLSQFRGRTDLLDYAKEHNIPVEATKEKPFSTDENLMHISYESGILEDPKMAPPEHMFQKTVRPTKAPDKETRIEIHFKDGIPFQVINREDGTVKERPLELFQYLNRLGRENGVGRIDIVENRFVGIKSRGVYETPAGTILRIAHLDIEGIAMDREVQKLRDMLTPKISELIYNGFWFSPEMDFLMSAIDKSQEVIDGVVHLSLYKGNVTVLGRESPSSLYDKDLSSMDVEGGFNQEDSRGFINIHAIRLKAHHAILSKRGKWPMPFMRD